MDSTLSSRDFKRILLIKPSALGDVIHTIPLLSQLRARYPSAQIDWLLTPENAELLRCHPALSNVVIFERRKHAALGRDTIADAWQLLSKIFRAKYDLVLDMHGQFRSAAFAAASLAPVRIGFDRPIKDKRRAMVDDGTRNIPERGWSGAREGSWLAYSHRIPIETLDIHAVDRYLWIGKMLGFKEAPPDFTIHLPPEAIAFTDQLMKEHGMLDRPLALLVPGTVWATKHWHSEGFAGVGRHLSGKGYTVALAGTGRDHPRCEEIAALCPGSINLAGKTSPAHLAALIQQAAICVTNDSGSMHLAVALNRPVVSVFGPTDPICIGPYGRPEAVVRVNLPCSPCNYRKLSQCPNNHACMENVTAQMVVERIEHILRQDQTDLPSASPRY